ncbi:MAG: aminoacyl-tRNA hydrolase [Acidobacteriota bacterium]
MADRAPTCAVVGLGNPGSRYVGTRHNVGFRVVEELASRHDAQLGGEACRCRAAHAGDVLLVAPQTFMNRSGWAARCLADRHDLAAEAFLIVYDDVHLPLGTLRLRPQGRPAGHRGLESVIENLGTAEVPRLRLGVGPRDGEAIAGETLADFVLEAFEPNEQQDVDRMIRRAADACSTWASEGADAAMQRFNGPLPADAAAPIDQPTVDAAG